MAIVLIYSSPAFSVSADTKIKNKKIQRTPVRLKLFNFNVLIAPT
ncbi:hypothetical protein W04_0046 [Pseudoalteromonas sp. SW0106-04]|nr:hypothetical protein W04_0046 [Pseudoalteromonas sp. SW0106-04]